MGVALFVFAAGLCRAVDGDTLACGKERVRLARINAPERHAAGGSESTDFLRVRIEGRRVICTVTGREKYGRLLSECFVGEGSSLSDQLLDAGMAVPYRGRKTR